MAGASPKTVFGFTAFTISVTAGQLFLGFNRSYVFIVLASVCCGITEVYSGDLDNISVVMVYILIDILLWFDHLFDKKRKIFMDLWTVF